MPRTSDLVLRCFAVLNKLVPERFSGAVLEGSDAVLEGSDAVLEGSDAVLEGSDAVLEGSDAVLEGKKPRGLTWRF